MTRELRAHHFGADDVDMIAVPDIVGALGDSPMLFVPRATRCRLLRMHGAVVLAVLPGDTADRVKIALVRGGVAVPDKWPPAEILWAHVMFHGITGVPNNLHNSMSGVQVEVNLRERRGSTLSSRGPMSNRRVGWQIIGLAGVTSPTIMMELIVEYEMEWLGGSGSKEDMDNDSDDEVYQ